MTIHYSATRIRCESSSTISFAWNFILAAAPFITLWPFFCIAFLFRTFIIFHASLPIIYRIANIRDSSFCRCGIRLLLSSAPIPHPIQFILYLESTTNRYAKLRLLFGEYRRAVEASQSERFAIRLEVNTYLIDELKSIPP